MQKYWTKIDEAVEGPYDGKTLRFVDGFTPETLVSPDETSSQDIWVKAGEIEEIHSFLIEISSPPDRDSNSETRAGPCPQTIEEIWESSAELTLEPEVPEPAPPADPVITEPAAIEEPRTQAIETPPPLPPMAETKQSSKEDPNSSNELLDVMEKISEEMDKVKEDLDTYTVPLPETAPPAAISPGKKTTDFKPVAQKPRIKNLKKPILVIGGLFILLTATVLGLKTQLLQGWIGQMRAKLFSQEKTIETASVVQPPPKKIVSLQPIGEKINPVKKPAVPKKKEVAVKSKPKSVKPAPVKAVRKKTPEKLESQDFMLPGVPSPNVENSKIPEEPTEQEEKQEEKPQDNAILKREKIKKSQEQFDDIDWMNQTGWGQ